MPITQTHRSGPLSTLAPRALASAAGLAMAVALAAPVVAQDGAIEAPMAPATSFSESEIDAFVDVALQVAAIRDDYALALQEAADEAEQQEIIQQGNAAMLAVVEEAPEITVEDYITIGEAAAADPELGQRIVMLMEERAQTDR